MKAEALKQFQNGLVSGTGDKSVTITQTDVDGNEQEYTYNLVGAANEIGGVIDEMENYDLDLTEITPEQEKQLDRGQKAFQKQMKKISDAADAIAGDDGAIELPNGKTVDLPNQASDVAQGNRPTTPGNN